MMRLRMREGFKEMLQDAEERGAIITSLTSKPSPADVMAQTQATNARVLKAYEMYLRSTIASEKTVNRHLMRASVSSSATRHVCREPADAGSANKTKSIDELRAIRRPVAWSLLLTV